MGPPCTMYNGDRAACVQGPGRVERSLMPISIIPFPDIDPVLVAIGPFAIRWYALAYIFGILLGWAYARAMIRDERNWGGGRH